MAARWKLTIRSGPRVQRAVYPDLDAALAQLEERARGLAQEASEHPADTRLKRYEPGQQVVGRLEVAGPERFVPSVRAGIDVRGDGSVQAYSGRTPRQLIEPLRGESPYSALRRSVAPA